MCFTEVLLNANLKIIIEFFYANIAEIDFTNDLVVIVWGKQVKFEPSLTNSYYNILDVDNELYKARSEEAGHEWSIRHFHGIHIPKTIFKNMHVESTNFS